MNKNKNKKRVVAGILCVVMLVSLIASIVGGVWTPNKDKHEDHNHETEITETETPVVDETEAPVEDELNEDEVPDEVQGIDETQLIENVKNYVNEGETDVRAILNKLAESGEIPFGCMVEELSDEFMMGLTEPVTKFKDGAVMMPMISSQAFIAYLFETSDAGVLMAELKEFADPRWNICTEATNTICENIGDYVFFAMTP